MTDRLAVIACVNVSVWFGTWAGLMTFTSATFLHAFIGANLAIAAVNVTMTVVTLAR